MGASVRCLLPTAYCLLLSVFCFLPPSAAASASDAARRGEDFRRRWELERAEAAFREAARTDPANLDAALGLARIARARFNYAGALQLLDGARQQHANSADLIAEYGLLYLAVEEPGRALDYLERALKQNPLCAAAVTGRAGVDLLNRDYRGAEERLRGHIQKNPRNSAAHALLARVLLEVNRNAEAEASGLRALELDPYNTDALYALAFVKATRRKPDEVRALARRAMALDPLNPGVRRLLSQYIDGQAGYNQKIPDAARKLYERGAALKAEGKMAAAVSEFEAALRAEPRYYRALIALGDIWLREGDYERAAISARLALEVDAEGALAHLELSYAHWGVQEQARVAIGAADFAELFYKQPRPQAFGLTAEVFPNYRMLAPARRVVIDRAVAPLAHYLPELARRGARHFLLPFDQRVSDVKEFNDVQDQKTFDGRYYASVRGVGGRITVSGIEHVDMAARGGFSSIAHEFAHQVHMTAMGKEEVRAIRGLYEQAMREKRTLDFYAAANEYEYFAQGYEAFISDRKRPSAGVTARHTRQELMARDPQLYDFILKLSLQSHARAA